MAESKLIQIAQELRIQARAKPGQPARYPLSGGLRLVMLYHELPPRWQVSLVRPGVEPSRREVATIRRDFGIPDDAREEREKSGVFRVIRLKWSEPVQLSFSFEEPGRAVAIVTPARNYQED